MQFKKTLLITAFAMALSACGPNYDAMSYDELVANANKEIKAAAAMKYEWRDTGKILKKAAAAKKAGDEAKAKKLARQALDQALLAQKQAKAESSPHVAFN